MNIKDNIDYYPENKDGWPYSWKCDFEELYKFKTWVNLTNANIFWGEWDEDSEENRIELKHVGFPMSEEEKEYLLEYAKMMEE